MAVPKEAPDGGATEDDRETVRHEGLVYSFLGMVGNLDISPRYYGVFEDSVGSVALVLDYGGTAVKSFNTLTRKQAQILFDKAVAMHAVGVVHNDLEPRNIVQDLEGELRIIDFHVADMGHRCAGKEKCEELLAFSRALKL
ncbi:hypothetical protein DFH07DRAFT_794577 [Mycena maculata]|uniref:Protein kinase domain-containing protein n=1 Tax=Mycena maculata TaxID=230809 RepID=A0AAD7K8H1_9AGAR|nr:hypothetical protein DFH07DRAFT_794577 [Mycena maculata]